MADSKTGLRGSIVVGSDIIFDFYCGPCDSENLHAEASGYCEQCQEYICDGCIKNHSKYAVFRSHKILDRAKMPKGKIIPKVRDVLTETCPTHLDKVLEYFCDIHKELCCSVCLNTTHKKCEDTAYVPDVADGAANRQEYKDVVSKFDRLVAMATKEQMKLDSNYSNNEAYRSKAITNIKAFRKKVDKELDNAEQDAIMKVSALHRDNSNKIKSATQKCQSVLSEANVVTTGLVEKSSANKKNQLFVDMKLATRRIDAIETEIKDAADCKISRYVFNQDEKVQAMVTSLSAIWSLSVRQDGDDTEARYLGEVNVKSTEDAKECNIIGMAVLTGGRVVMADLDNVAVKLLDRKLNKVTSRLSMSSRPYDLTRTEDNQVAVSLGEQQKIEILTVSNVLSRSRTIDVHGNGFQGIHYNGDNLVLALPHARSFKTVDMTGRILSTVYADNDVDPLFKFPCCIFLNKDKDVMYVTDKEAKSLTTMTLKGNIISVYRHESGFPVGVTVGRDGSVYACYNNQTVHQLSATGQHVQILLDQERGLAPRPYAIAYDEDGDRLIVSSGSPKPEYRNYVRLFQLD